MSPVRLNVRVRRHHHLLPFLQVQWYVSVSFTQEEPPHPRGISSCHNSLFSLSYTSPYPTHMYPIHIEQHLGAVRYVQINMLKLCEMQSHSAFEFKSLWEINVFLNPVKAFEIFSFQSFKRILEKNLPYLPLAPSWETSLAWFCNCLNYFWFANQLLDMVPTNWTLHLKAS